MQRQIKEYIEQNTSSMLDILKELCLIPAPSHFEHERAKYCKNWLESVGGRGVYIDEALNVIFPLNCDGSNEITVFAAHTDTVFPDMEPLPYFDDGEKIHCPGASDDTASVVVLLMMAKFFIEKQLVPKNGILFVFNACEEGLGDLKGTRQLFKDFAGRIEKFITFDSALTKIFDRCAGSQRYEVEAVTAGGHSFSNFGAANAIAALSNIITEIYKIDVPKKDGTQTTYNVGTISGGTSVNTIAQSAKMLCEYRSNNKDCMEFMQTKFEEIFAAAKAEDVEIRVTKVGDRPCGNIDYKKVQALIDIVAPIIEDVTGINPITAEGSTDCNIPLSLGISALCIGVNNHGGVHTREEWLEKASLVPGLEIAIRYGLALTEV